MLFPFRPFSATPAPMVSELFLHYILIRYFVADVLDRNFHYS